MSPPETSQTRAGERRWFIGGAYDDETGQPIPVDYEELVGEGVKIAGILERFGGHFQMAAYRVDDFLAAFRFPPDAIALFRSAARQIGFD